jgi:L-seryl-tRNA(Ser) seleniumtransferase
LTLSYEELLNRIKKISGVLDIKHTVEESYSLIGGGSMPDVKIPSPVIAIHTSIDTNLISKLASLDIPIIPRIKDEKIIFDLRSSFEIDDELIANALKNL